MRALTFAEMRAKSDDELVRLHDEHASAYVGLDYFRDELAGRRADRQMATVVRLTWVITVATILNTLLVAVSLFLVATAD